MGGRVDGARAITNIVPIACETTRSNDGIVLRVVPVVIVVQSVVHTSAQNVANVGKCHDECRKFTHELKYRAVETVLGGRVTVHCLEKIYLFKSWWRVSRP